MYRNILVPIDIANAERGKAMVAKAKALRDTGGKITLLNVVESFQGFVMAEIPTSVFEDREKEAAAAIRTLADALGGGFEIAVRTGKPAAEILQAAKDGGVDLIVIASHNPGMQDFFIGSTAARVVRHAHCSVLVDRRPD
jgi:nucleotide-binding universal stress UspA family protein